MSWNTEERKPFLLKPPAKDYLWGGRRLNDEFAKNIDMSPLAETWECSTHPDGPSLVASGEYYGKTLAEVLAEKPEYLGSHPKAIGDLPVLIKFIDANKDLSVQVHPDDAYAFENENGQHGKTEMWYVLDASPGAELVYGFRYTITKDQLKDAAAEGTLDKYLNRIPVRKNEVYFIRPGLVHAIGAGVLIAEIQESSNLTYRLYDYDRIDKNGHKRRLHIEKALDVADLNSTANLRQPIRKIEYRPGIAKELLARCKYFETYRLIVNTERKQEVHLRTDELSFKALLCINGCGTMSFCNEHLNIYKGDCFFIPADSTMINIHGKMELLEINS